MKKQLIPLLLILTVFALYSITWAEESTTANPGEDAVQMAVQQLMQAFIAQDVAKIEALIPEVLPMLEEKAKMDSTDDSLYFALHLCYLFYEDKVLALEAIEKAHTLDPENHFYTFYYALALKMNWRPLEARTLLAQVSEALDHPIEIDLYVNTVDLTIQQYESAENFYTSILEELEGENRSIVLSDLGLIKLHQGEHSAAIVYLEESIALVPNNVVAKSRLGEALIKSGQIEEGITYLDNVLNEKPDYVEALYYKATGLELLQQPADSQLYYERAYQFALDSLQFSNDDGREHFIFSQICFKLGFQELGQIHLANAKTLLYEYEAPFAEVNKQ